MQKENSNKENKRDNSENPNNLTQQKYIHFQCTADKGQSLIRIDKYLMDKIEGVSRNKIQQAAEADCILVNDNPVKSNYRVKPHDVISLVMDHPRIEVKITPEDIPLNIVYEDSDLMVINKQAGIVVHPGHGNYSGTLLNAIAHHLKDEPHFDANDPNLGLVHRLDKDTSGLLLIAKTPDAKKFLAQQFSDRTTKREYIALVWGSVDENEGIIEKNIGRNPNNRLLMCVFPEGDEGRTAITHYKVEERLGYVTLVSCKLETGRTHQIRVHMKHLGHPLYNDERYGGSEILRGTNSSKYRQFVRNSFEECPRQCLHAKVLGFIHPTTKEEMIFESDLPDDMMKVVKRWRSFAANNVI